MFSREKEITLGSRIIALRLCPNGRVRTPKEIAKILRREGASLSPQIIKMYLEKGVFKESEDAINTKQSGKNKKKPRCYLDPPPSSIEILDEQIAVGHEIISRLARYEKLSFDDQLRQIRGWAAGVRPLNELLKTRLSVFGLTLTRASDMTDDQLLREYDLLRGADGSGSSRDGPRKGDPEAWDPDRPN